MATSLAVISKQAIPGWNGSPSGNCTNAVVYWLWYVAEEKTAHDTAGFAAFVGSVKKGSSGSTARFVASMVRATGTERSKPKKALTPNKGSIVVFMKEKQSLIAAHACINGGEDTLYGYNQQGWLHNCAHGAHNHCVGGHPTSCIRWDDDGWAVRDDNQDDQYYLFTVKEYWAVKYFKKYKDESSKW